MESSRHGLRPDRHDLRSLLVAERACAVVGPEPRPGVAAEGGLRAGTPMPRRPRLRLRAGQTELPEAPPLGVLAFSRLAYGPRAGDLERFQALGATDEARWAAFVEQQLHPEAIDDSDCEQRLAQAGFATLGKSRAELWTEHHANDPDWKVRVQPTVETERATFLRAIWSRRQLFELLVEAWHDHFNVYGWDYISAPTWVHYDRDVIRANALGSFRAMLGAVAESPAMLVYLDNWTNTVAGPNENWARELLELHTLGAEHYLGVRRQDQVPLDHDGLPVGYVDDDVYETTRCFTGWTLDEKTGATIVRADWHDRFQKRVLGRFIPPNQAPFEDGREVLDVLASHPGTARHVALRLCRRLVADDPPPAVVEAAAATFLAAREAPDQLRQVVRTIVMAPELRASWGRKVRRPYERVVSALRASGAELPLAGDEDTTNGFLWMFDATAHARFTWRPPNGYPDRAEDWLAAGTLVAAWRLLNWLSVAHRHAGAQELPVVDALGQLPGGAISARACVAFWTARLLGRPPSEGTSAHLVDFMAQGRNPDLPLDLGEELVQERVRALVALVLMSPDHGWR